MYNNAQGLSAKSSYDAFNGDQECPENSYSTQHNDAVIDLLRMRGVFYSFMAWHLKNYI